MDIRRAQPAKAASLAALWLRSRTDSGPAIPPTVHTDEEVHRWFEEVVLPSCEVWLAASEGEVNGLLVLNNQWIDQLYVESTLTGRCIGGALLEHPMRLRPDGLKLWTFQSNRRARHFYEAHGLVSIAETMGDNEEGAPDVCYEWRPVERPRLSELR